VSGTLLAIDSLRLLATEALPTTEGHLEVDRVDLHRVAAGARALGSNEGSTRAAEGFVEGLTRLEVVADGGFEEDERLLGRVIESWLSGARRNGRAAGAFTGDRGTSTLF
jgi:hypothetical protein